MVHKGIKGEICVLISPAKPSYLDHAGIQANDWTSLGAPIFCPSRVSMKNREKAGQISVGGRTSK